MVVAVALMALSQGGMRAQQVNGGGGPPQQTPKSQTSISEQTRRAAEQGDARAQYDVALSEYALSRELNWTMPGPRVSPPEQQAASARWKDAPESDARQAAMAGDRGALWFVHEIDRIRAGEHRDKGFEWLKKAAAQQFPAAEYRLGIIYINWRLKPGSTEEQQGFNMVRHAMEAGYEPAQHHWAEMLLEGGWLTPDVPRAVELLRTAADQGCPRAQFQLAEQYACGNGEPRTAQEAPIALLTHAANAGIIEAQFALGERCRFGFGAEKNKARAFYWYSLAAAGNSTDAAKQRDKLIPALTADEMAQVAKWLSEEKPRHSRPLWED